MPRGNDPLPGASRPRPTGCALEAARTFFRHGGEVIFVNCSHWTVEIVECARAGMPPGAPLQEHMGQCPRCARCWEDEHGLSAQFRAMRAAAELRLSESRREQVMQEFDLAHRSFIPASVKWLLSAAAVLLLTVAVGYGWRNSRRPQAMEASIETIEDVADDNGFVAIPYAPPLATGEFVRVVETELQPIALARMGIYVDEADSSEIPAELLLGEDGFPRAVRVIEETQF